MRLVIFAGGDVCRAECRHQTGANVGGSHRVSGKHIGEFLLPKRLLPLRFGWIRVSDLNFLKLLLERETAVGLIDPRTYIMTELMHRDREVPDTVIRKRKAYDAGRFREEISV